MKSTVRLTDKMQFDVEAGGHHFPIDAKAEFGGTDAGPTPKVLMMSALAGCAAMDIISILRKMRAEPSALHVTADSGLCPKTTPRCSPTCACGWRPRGTSR